MHKDTERSKYFKYALLYNALKLFDMFTMVGGAFAISPYVPEVLRTLVCVGSLGLFAVGVVATVAVKKKLLDIQATIEKKAIEDGINSIYLRHVSGTNISIPPINSTNRKN